MPTFYLATTVFSGINFGLNFLSKYVDTTIQGAPLQISVITLSERIIGIDIKPSNGLLYAVTRDTLSSPDVGGATLYTIDPITATATFLSALTFSVSGLRVILADSTFGVDIDPITGFLRIVNPTVNYRVSTTPGPTLGKTFVDAAISPLLSGEHIIGAAYTQDVSPSPSSTTLFDLGYNIDSAAISLYTQDQITQSLTQKGIQALAVTETSDCFDIKKGRFDFTEF